MSEHRTPIYFQLNQGERASHLRVNQLLARPVYERLAMMLRESLPQDGNGNGCEFDEEERFTRGRGHSTIFLDGDRGTGKTTVIVNLPQYLKSQEVTEQFPGLADDVHIFRPIDPSQLEDGDNLFLDVVVAAVLGDKDVNAQRELKHQDWQALHASLQRLGSALQGSETQNVGFGLDKLRAFMGSQELAGAVHEFFSRAATLLGKRLLVLPIDDVDTTLHRAFENLEVVRRYLSSPVLLPIVCGDLSLYREVTWRDAFKRLTKDTAAYHEQAKPFADDLAREYLRKILPLHRRLPMLGVDDFLKNDEILLGAEEAKDASLLTLPQFGAWLQTLLAGAVNGHENSRLLIPIPTVRALSQLLFRVRDEIPLLEEALGTGREPLPETDLMQRIFNRQRGETPSEIRIAPQAPPASRSNRVSLSTWHEALLGHFMYETRAGAACLVLMAAQHWRQNKATSVLATPLFDPLRQVDQPILRYIETRAALNWKADLELRLPASWVQSLPNESILPFASPEIGRAVKLKRGDQDLMTAGGWVLRLVLDLATHRNFYASSKQATLICSGRILELVVTSLVRDPTWQDIERIQVGSPFHSAATVAPTKPVLIDNDEEEEEPSQVTQESVSGTFRSDVDLRVFLDEIITWRKDHRISEWAQSPWLIYCSLNKAFNQAPSFNKPLSVGQQPTTERTSLVVESALAAFNSFWAAVASFEKGPLFNLPIQLSNVNLNPDKDFELNELFLQNIRPFLGRQHIDEAVDDEEVISIARTLAQHPLRKKLRELTAALKQAEPPLQVRQEPSVTARDRLISILKLRKELKRFRGDTLIQAIIEQAAAYGMPPTDFAAQVYDLMDQHHRGDAVMRNLEAAIKELRNKR